MGSASGLPGSWTMRKRRRILSAPTARARPAHVAGARAAFHRVLIADADRWQTERRSADGTGLRLALLVMRVVFMFATLPAIVSIRVRWATSALADRHREASNMILPSVVCDRAPASQPRAIGPFIRRTCSRRLGGANLTSQLTLFLLERQFHRRELPTSIARSSDCASARSSRRPTSIASTDRLFPSWNRMPSLRRFSTSTVRSAQILARGPSPAAPADLVEPAFRLKLRADRQILLLRSPGVSMFATFFGQQALPSRRELQHAAR